MKKAYVKVKENSVKSIFKRPYIAATIIGAILCAAVLSVSVPKQNAPAEKEKLAIPTDSVETPEQKPEITSIPNAVPQEPEPEKTKKAEVITESKPEVTVPETKETAVEETVSAGIFKGNKEITMVKPTEGETLKAFSSGKPVKSKTMGDWRAHNGMDIRAEAGTKVLCPADGEVIRAETDGLTGATISIDHGSGVISTVYNLENTDGVKLGQKIKRGDAIGTAGNTAKCEMLEGPHIHFEVTKDGVYVNPESMIP